MCLLYAFALLAILDYTSEMNVKETCPTQTSADFERITLRYIPEGEILFAYDYSLMVLFIKLPNPSGRIRPWGLLSL
jgi:hypothetical protein